MRPLSLRSVFWGAAIVLGGLGALASAALVYVGGQLSLQTEQMANVLGSVHATEELEVELLRVDRERRLLQVTGDAVHRQNIRDAVERLRTQRRRIQVGSLTGEEAEVAAALEREVDAFLELVDAADVDARREQMSRASRLAGQLTEINANQAQAFLDEAKALNILAERTAVVLAVAFLLGLAVVLLLVRAWVFTPLRTFERVVARFREDRGQRVRSGGVREVRDLQAQFNGLADALREQEERQLAFLSAVAHELRNPLGALKLHAALVARQQGEAAPAMQRIMHQVDQLDRMVGDLLDRTRIESGNLEIKRQRCDVREIARAVVALHQADSPLHPLRLEVPDAPLWVECDPGRVDQVVTNLVSNAIKYSPGGGEVTVRVGPLEGGAFVEVEDKGIGIAPEDQAKLFLPFRRAESALKGEIPGVGLGLSVCKRIVEAHGGRIEVESTPGVGSTFRVWLPGAPLGTGAPPPDPAPRLDV